MGGKNLRRPTIFSMENIRANDDVKYWIGHWKIPPKVSISSYYVI